MTTIAASFIGRLLFTSADHTRKAGRSGIRTSRTGWEILAICDFLICDRRTYESPITNHELADACRRRNGPAIRPRSAGTTRRPMPAGAARALRRVATCEPFRAYGRGPEGTQPWRPARALNGDRRRKIWG